MKSNIKYIERAACVLLVIISIILTVLDYKKTITNVTLLNAIYGILLFYIIVYRIFYCGFRHDILRIGRIKKPKCADEKKGGTKPILRKGSEIVISLFGIYVASLTFCAYIFQNRIAFFVVLVVSVLMLLDNIFKYEFCIIRLFADKDVRCCSDCYFAAWDDVLIFSALVFIPVVCNEMNIVIKVLIVMLIIYALIKCLCWDWTMELHPERFNRDYNKYLICPDCQLGWVGSDTEKHCNGNCDRPASLIKNIEENAWLKEHLARGKSIIRHNYVIVSISGALVTLVAAYWLMGKEYFLDNYIFCIIVYFEIPLWLAIYKWVEASYKRVFEANMMSIFDIEGDNQCIVKEKSAERIFKMYTYKNLFIFVCVNISNFPQGFSS